MRRADVWRREAALRERVLSWVRERYLLESPSFSLVFVPLCLLSIALYTRHPFTNFIFDEQEALIGNPYVRAVADPKSSIRWLDAFHRDFWGRLPATTIGSYRPLPNLVWRLLWMVGARDQSAFPHHYVNVLLHAANGALLVLFLHRVTRDRALSWLAGVLFVATAVVTEAVSGVVGIADVLGGLGAIVALLAVTTSSRLLPVSVFFATLLGLLSKESALSLVPLIPVCAILLDPDAHPERPRPWLRALGAAVGTVGAFVLYVELRRRLFPTAPSPALLPEAVAGKPLVSRIFAAILRWYAQPGMPQDRFNNPLIVAPFALRVAGALRVYSRGVFQVFCPWTLAGDYSAPEEPIPDSTVNGASIVGATLLILPLVTAVALLLTSAVRRGRRESPTDWRKLAAFLLVWVVVCYLPVSNIPITLPTVRAERFWYLPAVGTASLLAMLLLGLYRAALRRGSTRGVAFVFWGGFCFLALQCASARKHANDYKNDLAFWDATRRAAPRSAKAHLNYSVMLGARGDNNARLASSRVALELAPEWPMANIYVGDTLCRMHRTDEAIPYYKRGFDLGPSDQVLIALGLQCLWDEGALVDGAPLRDELRQQAERYPGTWLARLVEDTLESGEEWQGVEPRYRARSYNEGPRESD